MYLETGLRGVFKPRSRYKQPRLSYVTVYWDLEVPFRKDFGAFRQELSTTIRKLVTAEIDKKRIDGILLDDKNQLSRVAQLKSVHGQLLKQQSPKLKDSDPVGITAEIRFHKTDYTDVGLVFVTRR